MEILVGICALEEFLKALLGKRVWADTAVGQ